jgi:hypothetical protein
MLESAVLVMRLAALVFSSPIAMWKLQNEFRVPPERLVGRDKNPSHERIRRRGPRGARSARQRAGAAGMPREQSTARGGREPISS